MYTHAVMMRFLYFIILIRGKELEVVLLTSASSSLSCCSVNSRKVKIWNWVQELVLSWIWWYVCLKYIWKKFWKTRIIQKLSGWQVINVVSIEIFAFSQMNVKVSASYYHNKYIHQLSQHSSRMECCHFLTNYYLKICDEVYFITLTFL